MLLDTGRAIVQTAQLGTCCMQCMAECNNYILYAIRPRPIRQEKSFRTPDPLSTFRWGSGHETKQGNILFLVQKMAGNQCGWVQNTTIFPAKCSCLYRDTAMFLLCFPKASLVPTPCAPPSEKRSGE